MGSSVLSVSSLPGLAREKILDSLGGRYDKLWPRIGWKKDGIWTRYPKSFDWSIEAPNGHMPLVNQLRGVRLMDALLNHQGFKNLKANI